MIQELKEEIKINALKRYSSFMRRVDGSKILECPAKFAQYMMKLLSHDTKPFAVPNVIELSINFFSPSVTLEELPKADNSSKCRGRMR